MKGSNIMSKKIRNDDEIIQVFNEHGSKAARDFITETYNIKNPWNVLQQLKRASMNGYSKELKKFVVGSPVAREPVFLNLEELDSKELPTQVISIESKINHANQPLEGLMQDLIHDHVQEVSKYIKLKQSFRLVTINLSALKEAGYNVTVI